MLKSIKSSFGPKFKEYEIGNIVNISESVTLRSKAKIKNFNLAYQTYGKLNNDKSNSILICHALTGDQYAASQNPVTKKEGWWNFMIGRNKPIDTNKYFVICVNIIGGCMGSFGPKDMNLKTNRIYGLDFPVITIYDMVKTQKLLIDSFGIRKLQSIIGGSMGGMLALTWVYLYPEVAKSVIAIATSYKHSTQNIAFNEVSRQAIMTDPNWLSGKYLENKKYPEKGLAIARMTSHITYLSKNGLHQKFGRNLQNKSNLSYKFDVEFQIESYLRYNSFSFIERFDPNSYLYITKAMDYFDLEEENKGNLSNAFKNKNTKFCILSFSDDWLFSSSESKKIVKALNIAEVNASFLNINSTHGHDSFLIENDPLKSSISGFLNSI